MACWPRAETVTRLNYLGSAARRADSFWVPDHLNAMFPKALWQPQYCRTVKITPSVDAYMEPWMMLGNLAAATGSARLRLGVAVTDTGRRNPAVTAQAAYTLDLRTRGAILRYRHGGAGGQRTLRCRLVPTSPGRSPYFEEAMATIRAL